MHQQAITRRVRRTFQLATTLFVLGGCLPQGEVDDPDTAPDDPDSLQDHQLVGSVGDGPIVEADVVVATSDGTELDTTNSGLTASFDVTVKTRGSYYPLRIRASGGTDLVTQNQPDFTVSSLVVKPGNKTVANLNPFSAVAYETAVDMAGGVTESNVVAALGIVGRELNSGLTTLRGSGIMTAAIDETNITEALRASEALGEIVRRVRSHLQSAGIGVTGDDIVAAVGSDLVDGVLDGRGGPRTDPRVSALTGLARAQVALETMQNLLRVQGSDVMLRLNSVLAQVFSATPEQSFDELTLSADLASSATVGLLAANTLQPSAEAQALLGEMDGVSAGMLPAAVRQVLSGDGRTTFSSSMSAIASGSAADIETVNAVLRTGTAPSQNTPPVISGSPATSVAAGSAYSFVPAASDSDGDTLTFNIAGKPAWASFDAATGTLAGSPQQADTGSYSGITVSVTDGEDTASLPAFTITVTDGAGGNSPPEISGNPPTAVTVGSNFSFTPQASDPDGDSLTFSISSPPAWATFDPASGRLSGTPGSGDVGIWGEIRITVSDGQASDTLGPFAIEVTAAPVNTPPTIGGTPPATVTEGNAYSFTPQANDADGDSLTFSVDNLPGWAVFDSGNGRISGTPGVGDVGSWDGIAISVTDGEDTATLGPFSIAVEALATGTATLSWTPPTENTDGTPLTDLSGYRIYWGTSSGDYSDSVTLDNPGLTSYVVENLAPGTWYFVSTAINTDGVESDLSNEATKTIQ